MYGTVKNVEMLGDRFHPEFSRGFAYVELENADNADKAVKHLDGGMYILIIIINYYHLSFSILFYFPVQYTFRKLDLSKHFRPAFSSKLTI